MRDSLPLGLGKAGGASRGLETPLSPIPLPLKGIPEREKGSQALASDFEVSSALV